jgi:transposase
MPDDFKEHAPTAKNPDLAARYSTSITMIQRWRREAGIRGTAKANRKGRRPKMRAPMPDDFAELARTHFNHQLCKKYGVGMKLVSRWRAECGVAYERPHPPPKPPRQPKPPRERKSKPGVINSMGRGHCVGFAPPRDTTLEGQAAEVLRRLAPCYRCDEMGRQETNRPKDHWRWGMVVMAPDELFARARSKGWEAST